jgi:diguanylate cyclase (GGDEF)-like protein
VQGDPDRRSCDQPRDDGTCRRACGRRLLPSRRDVPPAPAALERLAREDHLTGLANRRRFFQHAELEWRRALRSGSSLTAALLDLDHFKRFDDVYGHPAGDRCLQAVGRVLTERIQRAGDIAARHGGEESIVLLCSTDLEGACRVAEKLRAAVAELHLHDAGPEGSHQVTVSIGIATVVPREGHTLDELIAAADRALYRAKAEGRNRVVSVVLGPA